VSAPVTIPNQSIEATSVRDKNSSAKRIPALSRWPLFCAVFLIASLGLWWAIAPQLPELWELWMGNGLASMGILVPPAVTILIVLAWRGERWKTGGTWWGLALCAFTLLLIAFMKRYGTPVILSETGTLHLVPVGLVVFFYVSGVVLLFAGFKAYRLAFFPITLLLLVNPAPKFFISAIDIPLQYVGAHTARSFAQLIGVPLASDNLRLMFSPALGMFIAPGCNGLRGALAMGFLTLVLGYFYRLPLWFRSVYFLSGVLLAYLLNLVRLCGLVLCYRVALGFEPLARHMEAADYVLGSLIFFTGAIFVVAVPRKWNKLKKIPANS